MNDTMIKLRFIRIKEGKEYLVTIPADATRESFAEIISNELKNPGVILSNCHIFRFSNKEE